MFTYSILEQGQPRRLDAIVLALALLGATTSACSSADPITVVYGSPDSKVLEVGLAACNPKVDTDVTEEHEAVFLRVRILEEEEEHECGGSTIIRLASVLGDRKVIDAETGRQLVVTPAEQGQSTSR